MQSSKEGVISPGAEVERCSYSHISFLHQHSKSDQAKLKVKDQDYWAKHSWVIFSAPRGEVGEGAGENLVAGLEEGS